MGRGGGVWGEELLENHPGSGLRSVGAAARPATAYQLPATGYWLLATGYLLLSPATDSDPCLSVQSAQSAFHSRNVFLSGCLTYLVLLDHAESLRIGVAESTLPAQLNQLRAARHYEGGLERFDPGILELNKF